jgi:uncharacterized membrane protein YsdA (DUF1294 family)/cold shock CspA family protein
MNMQIGTILNWNEEKGFGFIAPKSGGKTIFAHINDYSRMHKSPFKGLEVQYLLSADQKGRRCAVEVCPLKGNKKSNRGLKQKSFSMILFSGFAYVLFVLYNSKSIPLELVGLYTVMSVIAFIIYAKDKNAAEYGKWRTSESTLHTLSLLGGWPGAAIAQSFLRHKSKKASFRFTNWVTVIVNCGALYWLITPAGSLWLRNIIKDINILIRNINIG